MCIRDRWMHCPSIWVDLRGALMVVYTELPLVDASPNEFEGPHIVIYTLKALVTSGQFHHCHGNDVKALAKIKKRIK